MDLQRLERDIPKWFQWLKETSVEEWESFLETPIATSTRECFLPLLQTIRHQTLRSHNEESDAPQQTEMRSVVSQSVHTQVDTQN